MQTFNVPTREDVTTGNQVIFDKLKTSLGFVPNLYAVIAYSEHALDNYLHFQNGKTSLSKKEKEVVNLIVSQVNDCRYCLSAHTAISKLNGFSEDQILELRRGSASFSSELDALVKLAGEIAAAKGRPSEKTLSTFFSAGFTNENLIDVVSLIGEKTIMNYIHNITQVPVDFPLAPELTVTHAK